MVSLDAAYSEIASSNPHSRSHACSATHQDDHTDSNAASGLELGANACPTALCNGAWRPGHSAAWARRGLAVKPAPNASQAAASLVLAPNDERG